MPNKINQIFEWKKKLRQKCRANLIVIANQMSHIYQSHKKIIPPERRFDGLGTYEMTLDLIYLLPVHIYWFRFGFKHINLITKSLNH